MVVTSSFIETADLKLTVDGPIPPYQFEWTVQNVNSLKTTPTNPVVIELNIPSQLYGLETLYFSFENPSTTVSATYGTVTQETGFHIPLNP